ncbi:unnamed protein product (macronuclear) [Paramecium tetraurelia]|uniref:ABC transporter domain-containing protein n=1 Tax=Paramecium tetraurelia TaxID=5888 RepID=A0BMH6_PARTE|nr:uncharacterized protein GSPATT00030379001 [Paramecium tetraurelia]CAK59743.1 unnamed protein product [Paramecium tetraurelia]|eukprot:XP_001427141.1 hypothetical protein (macronuclear) [Paramecium tetraurelia strain d4-2]
MGAPYTVGNVMIIFFSVVTGGFQIEQAGPCVQHFAKGRQAAVKIFAILNRIPKILNPQNSKKHGDFNGTILLKNVHFSYPNRPDQQVLKSQTQLFHQEMKLKEALQIEIFIINIFNSILTVALQFQIGESGCSKSTVMQLIERFYDCHQGEDGIKVKGLNVLELTSRIGLVGQEPELFATSIKENLLQGKIDATEEEMIDALKKANAWDFGSKMKQGLNTYFGIGGSQLNRGQIYNCQSYFKKPQILLLDKATSALDRTNERIIQQTVNQISKGITTIVIAHIISTIQNTDLIYVIDNGQVVESGTIEELINQIGKFEELAKNLIQTQMKEELEGNAQEYLKDPFRSKMNLAGQQIKQQQQRRNEKFKKLEVPTLIKKVSGKVAQGKGIETQQDQDSHMSLKENKLKQANECIFPIFSLLLGDMITVLVESNPSFADYQSHMTYDNPRKDLCDMLKKDLQDQVIVRMNFKEKKD